MDVYWLPVRDDKVLPKHRPVTHNRHTRGCVFLSAELTDAADGNLAKNLLHITEVYASMHRLMLV